ncbi:MAG: 3-hydroxyacyl-ACP dehydratase FabZ [Deltaproteobacteria bacterium]|nr:3-hydroxyacyl-ACP dehydratase FabZ [Deltaproteobacteria bacterium]
MTTMDIEEIKKRLKHRFPFLMIDRVLEFEDGQSCTAYKNISAGEIHFMGHFPEQSIFPGVLIIEAMAQTAGIAIYGAFENPDEGLMFFAGMDNVKFKKPVVPGDQLILKTQKIKQKMNFWVFKGEAFVDDKLVASAEFKLATAG